MIRKTLIFLALAAAAAVPARGAVDDASFSRNGKYVGKVQTYSYGGVVYFDAARLSRYLGGKIYWYPVSGSLVFQLKGKKVQASVKSDEVLFDKESAMIRAPVIVRGGKSFLSRDFFLSPSFNSCFGFSLRYDESSNSLEASEKMSVASFSHFSHKDKTRLVLYLNEPLEYQTFQRSHGLLMLVVSGGSVASPERISVDDGVVKSIDMTQDNKALRIGVAMGENASGFSAFKLSGPDRIVLDVMAKAPRQVGGEAPAAGSAGQRGEAPASPASAASPAQAPEIIAPSAPAAAESPAAPAAAPAVSVLPAAAAPS
ncbi:MAG: hypothetical protein RDU13_09050, partial [Elusimicrobiales bacterium]|nr:hypothetical protein [Elusimicrobiales bacterium]